MSDSSKLLEKLYDSLNLRLAEPMAECYHAAARFHDIAFDLRGKDQIRGMWQMICAGDISATYEVLRTDQREGVVRLVDCYTFSETQRRVRNEIESHFRFQDGLIIEHVDVCDPCAWADQALGGVAGFVAGRARFLRSRKARLLLKQFLETGALRRR